MRKMLLKGEPKFNRFESHNIEYAKRPISSTYNAKYQPMYQLLNYGGGSVLVRDFFSLNRISPFYLYDERMDPTYQNLSRVWMCNAIKLGPDKFQILIRLNTCGMNLKDAA